MSSPSPGAPTARSVGVVVVNWNAPNLTRRCVESLRRCEDAEQLDIVVVDNGSLDGSVDLLRAWFPDITVIPTGSNLGFAEGCNVGIRSLRDHDLIALVNNDAVVDRGWLPPLVETLDADPRVGAAAPKILFAAEFVTIQIETAGSGPHPRTPLMSIHVGPFDVTAHVLPGSGAVTVADPSEPGRVGLELAPSAEVHIPVGPGPQLIEVVLATHGPPSTTTTTTVAAPGSGVTAAERTPDGRGHRARVVIEADTPRVRRIDSMGTAVTEWGEGFDRHHGEPDDDIDAEESDGWCGGGVLLRKTYLDDIGLFDPAFFAYYEDTDLSWRGRRAGWRTMTAPRSVIHHLHGASAGRSWPAFFRTTNRNWLLTSIRNADRRRIVRAMRAAARAAWGPTRRNVTGRLRRGRRPDTALTRSWVGVGLGLIGAAPRTVASRRSRRIGVVAPPAVTPPGGGRGPAPRAPRPRPGGPVLVYVDVTETLRAGWRAGIQRVVTELTRGLRERDDERVDVVEVCWSSDHQAFRRLTAAEHRQLVDPPPMRTRPEPAPESGGLARRIAGRVTRTGPGEIAKNAVRQRLELRRRDPAQAALVLPRLEAGSVFFDPDASWNTTDAPRPELLGRLRADGVSIVGFIHDLLPVTSPAWFDPTLARIFGDHVRAHLNTADVLLCNSAHTRDEINRWCATHGIDRAPARVITMGAPALPAHVKQPAATEGASTVPTELRGRRFLLVVGTIEPRKNHGLVLDLFDQLAPQHPDLGLVIAGRQGWHVEEVAQRILSHPDLGDRLLWPEQVDDTMLHDLYRHCFAVVVPSITEGFGLPVLEALGHGCVVVTSGGGALAEVGGDAVMRVPDGGLTGFTDVIGGLLDDPDALRAARGRAAAFVPPGWSVGAAECADAFVEVHRERWWPGGRPVGR